MLDFTVEDVGWGKLPELILGENASNEEVFDWIEAFSFNTTIKRS